MRNNRTVKYLFLISFFTLFFIGCEKDESNKKTDPFISNTIDEANADSLRSYVEWLQNMETRFMLANNHREVAKKIQRKLISLGYTNTIVDSFRNTIAFEGSLYQTWQYNVIATLDGNLNPNEYCVVGAHYDSYTRDADLFTASPGADDNASGVATVLEIARLLKKRSFTPNSSIQFVAFAAEELGLFGSADFAIKSSSSHKAIKMMLNFDMVSKWLGGVYTVNIINYFNSKTLLEKAQDICSTYTILKTTNDNTFYNRSDSYSFYCYGYPAIFFTSTAENDSYHTINDRATNCNLYYGKEIAKAACALLIKENI